MRRRSFWRALGGIALVAVLALGFLGYMRPDLQLNWETLAAMCGF
ncbi:Phage protein [Bordetella tumbae]